MATTTDLDYLITDARQAADETVAALEALASEVDPTGEVATPLTDEQKAAVRDIVADLTNDLETHLGALRAASAE
ncbi:MAG: hypothetical protein E6R06_23765 [Mycobacterium sp.]|nr:MAG: hypothetical protein E6R06_23765 [Mycobacterium sp.]